MTVASLMNSLRPRLPVSGAAGDQAEHLQFPLAERLFAGAAHPAEQSGGHEGESTVSPRAAARTARNSSSRGASLSRYPVAPASIAGSTSLSVS